MECVNDAMKNFEAQVLDDSDIVEGEYFMDLIRLPRTRDEADRWAKKFEDEALHWEYPEDQQEEEVDTNQFY